jgi:hypothetical protein
VCLPKFLKSPPSRLIPIWVMSVVLCNRWLPVNFRYAPFATEFVSRGRIVTVTLPRYPL